jgi:purine-binding chemotaxis protein CheW
MTAVVTAEAGLRACLFSLAGELFAVDVRRAREVVVFDDFTLVPRAPAHVLGVANLRGYVIPILDVRLLLGAPPRPAGRPLRALVVDRAGVQVAVAVDDVLGLEYFEERVPEEVARRAHGEFGEALLRRGDRLVTLLDVSKLLETILGPAGGPAGSPAGGRGRTAGGEAP